jgi:hypothetical protein
MALRNMSHKSWHILCSRVSLAGVIGFACFCSTARAGEKIIFSAPSKALAMPAVEHAEKEDSPGLTVSPNFTGVDPGMGFAPQITVIMPVSRSLRGRNSDHNANRNDLGERDSSLSLDRNSDPNSDRDADQDGDRDRNPFDSNSERRPDFESMNDKDDIFGDTSASRGWPSAQKSFGSVTNRWDLGRSWNSSSSKNSSEMRRATDDNTRALRGYELGAWRVRTGTDDEKDDETTSTWKGSASTGFGGSIWSRTFGTRTSFWDKSRTGEIGQSKADDNKTFFQWSNKPTSDEPTSFGSVDGTERDSDAGFNASAAPLADKPFQFGDSKPEDQLSGALKDPTAYQMPDLSSPGFSDPIAKQDVISQPIAQQPMAPTVLPLPRMPGSLFR